MSFYLTPEAIQFTHSPGEVEPAAVDAGGLRVRRLAIAGRQIHTLQRIEWFSRMAEDKIGLWLVGARGGVATSTILGLLALRNKLTSSTGLVSALPTFEGLPLPAWDQFVIGGHEIRVTTLPEEALRLHRESRLFDAQLLDATRTELEEVDTRIRAGTLSNVGETIRKLAEGQQLEQEIGPRATIHRLQHDLESFRDDHQLSDVVVVNLASTEAPLDEDLWPQTWAEVESQLDSGDCQLPASTMYAIAALDLGMPYVNFTPSLGSTPAGIDELAQLRKTCHAGRDGKTGETLLKSVLAPMFAARNLEVLSWVGHNIFGNMDGQVLNDPANKASKVRSKDQLLSKVLGYSPQTVVSIEHVEGLGDWKTAWDHIHFQGFLGTPMSLQFTWQGCDSMLAAPLVLDLARFTILSHRQQEFGALSALSCFFKSPLNQEKQSFSDQMIELESWAARHS